MHIGESGPESSTQPTDQPATARHVSNAVSEIKRAMPSQGLGWLGVFFACFLATQCSTTSYRSDLQSIRGDLRRTQNTLNEVDRKLEQVTLQLKRAENGQHSTSNIERDADPQVE